MINLELQKLIIEVVENQIKMNDPKCAKETYDELIALGHSDEDAKKLIGNAVLTDIFDILKNGKEFDEEKYRKNLKKLVKEFGGKKISWNQN